ncbi:MAG: hypothetical protein ACK5PF_08295 [bacterium]|jgi:hypothetical protein
MSGLHDDFPPHAQAREEAMLREKAAARAELRDRFAMAALTGLLANPAEARISPAEWTYDAYRFADAMMKARGDE